MGEKMLREFKKCKKILKNTDTAIEGFSANPSGKRTTP